MKFALYLSCLLCTSWSTHKFYFSETLMEWKDPSDIEITIKVFSDDFEQAANSNENQTLFTLDSMYSNYIRQHFQLSDIHENPFRLNFVGYEKDGEFIYLYLENKNLTKQNLLLFNNILTELFPDQKNLVNYRCNGNTKSLYFFKDSKPQTIQWP